MYTFILQIYKSQVDTFAAVSNSSCQFILIKISAKPGPNTVTTLNYSISINGIKPDNMKIHIIRSISNIDDGK